MIQETNPKVALESVNSQDQCSQTFNERTTSVYVDNRTRAAIEICFAQVLDQSGQIPPGFGTDSGVFVLVTNGSPNSRYELDPCRAGGKTNPVQGTRIKASIKLVFNGKKQDINLEDGVAEAGEFFGNFGWTINEKSASMLFSDMPPLNQTKKK